MELLRALAALAEVPGERHPRIARSVGLRSAPDAADYTDLFTAQFYPYASVYLGEEGMLGGEACERIGGFWRALGAEVPPEPDHLATLLALYAEMAQRAVCEPDERRRTALEHAQRALLWEHLLPWAPVYARKMQTVASGCYREWAALLEAALHAAAQRHGPEPMLSAHLRVVGGVVDPRADGADAFIASLLAPARAGLILVRSDLQRAARGLRLGSRQGERRFALTALLAQDRAATLGWLAAEARASAAVHRSAATLAPGVRDFWADRAEGTAALLESLRRDAGDAELAAS